MSESSKTKSSSRKAVVIVGMGEMGAVFARGFLRLGHPVYPVLRGDSMAQLAAELAAPELVLIATGEADLQATLKQVPAAWRNRLGLLQNELLPADWQQQGIEPTVISVWFEKKTGQDVKVLIPSPVHGRHAQLLVAALAAIAVPARVVASAADMLYELMLKNVYIITTNVAGLSVGGSVGQLWSGHRELAQNIAHEVMQLQFAITGETFAPDRFIKGMLEAFNGDLDHNCMGRSAPARLQRARKLAKHYKLDLPTLELVALTLKN
jgi:ketopantoate reductase